MDLTPYPAVQSVTAQVNGTRALIRAGLDGNNIKQGRTLPTMATQALMSADDAVIWQAALILEGRRKILTSSQTKLDKARRWRNRGLTLSSAKEAAPWIHPKFDACAGRTAACTLVCVGSRTGQGMLPSSAIARIGRTIALHVAPGLWWSLYDLEMQSQLRSAERAGIRLAMRCNVATDHTHIAGESARRHPAAVHYDYTAILSAMRRKDGVQRVYSRKDGAARELLAQRALQSGHGVAVVFAVTAKSKGPLPKTWHGAPVVDGDIDDLWFTRKPPKGPYVVGLRVKGTNAQIKAAIASGFATFGSN